MKLKKTILGLAVVAVAGVNAYLANDVRLAKNQLSLLNLENVAEGQEYVESGTHNEVASERRSDGLIWGTIKSDDHEMVGYCDGSYRDCSVSYCGITFNGGMEGTYTVSSCK